MKNKTNTSSSEIEAEGIALFIKAGIFLVCWFVTESFLVAAALTIFLSSLISGMTHHYLR